MHAGRLPLHFDAKRLQTDLARIEPEEWIMHYNLDDYTGRWSVASLRSAGGSATMIYSSSLVHICRSTPLLDRCPYFQEVLTTVACPMSSVRLMQLYPGSIIKEHRDSFETHEERLHIPIQTNPDVHFLLDGEPIVMEEGELWWLDFRQPHAVRNEGQLPRIHLVLDCHRNDWLNALIVSALQDAATS